MLSRIRIEIWRKLSIIYLNKRVFRESLCFYKVLIIRYLWRGAYFESVHNPVKEDFFVRNSAKKPFMNLIIMAEN